MATELMSLAKHAERPLPAKWLEDLNAGSVVYRRWLYLVCRQFEVRFAVELGANLAMTTAHLAAGVSRGAIGIELKPDWEGISRAVGIVRANVRDTIYVIEGNTIEDIVQTEVELLVGTTGIDLLFIDSEHTAKQAQAEWDHWQKYMASPAVVVMDDILDPPELQAVFQGIPGEHVQMPQMHTVTGVPRHGQSVGFGAVIYG